MSITLNETVIHNYTNTQHIHYLYLTNCVEIYDSFRLSNIDVLIAPKLKNIYNSFNNGNIKYLFIPNCINVYESFKNIKIIFIKNNSLKNVCYSFTNLNKNTQITNKTIPNCINSFIGMNINYNLNVILNPNYTGLNNLYLNIENEIFNNYNGFYECKLNNIVFNSPWIGTFDNCELNNVVFNNSIICDHTFINCKGNHIIFNECIINTNILQKNFKNITFINCCICHDIFYDTLGKNIKTITIINSMFKYGNVIIVNKNKIKFINLLKSLGFETINNKIFEDYEIFNLNRDITINDYFIKNFSYLYTAFSKEYSETESLNTTKQYVNCDKINIYEYILNYFKNNQNFNNYCNEINNDLIMLQYVEIVKLLKRICGIKSLINFDDIK